MKRRIGTYLGLALIVLLSACGGGGGETGSGGGPPQLPGTTRFFAPDASVTALGGGLLYLGHLESESGLDTVAMSLNLVDVPDGLDLAAEVGGITGTLTYDATWLSLDRFEPEATGVEHGVAASVQGENGALVVAVTRPRERRLGVLYFTITGSGAPAHLAFDKTDYVTPDGVLMARAPLGARGGTLDLSAP